MVEFKVEKRLAMKKEMAGNLEDKGQKRQGGGEGRKKSIKGQVWQVPD